MSDNNVRSLFVVLVIGCVSAAASAVPAGEFQAGAAVVDITPRSLPVLVNGGMVSRSIDKVKTPLSARAIAVSDGNDTIVMVVVDSCMIGRVLLDDIKALAESQTGMAANHILISATHTHSAPSAMACLGTEADEAYIAFLRVKLVEAIAAARDHLEPAEVGFGKIDAADFTALRRWIRRPDRLAEDPFGNLSVRANMHAARNPDDVTGESGPEDPDLSLVAFRARSGRPIAVLANFSMHYFGDQNLSADYFGLFCQGLQERIAPHPPDGAPPFVGVLSHGCSGDIWRRDYTKSEEDWDRNQKTIEQYTAGLLNLAMQAWDGIQYDADATLAMEERRMTMQYRVPDAQRLEWARRIVSELGDQLPKTQPEIYAREQIILHERQQTEVVVQALRIGDIAIATTPNETYAITGLKIKAASPLDQTLVIELANGGDGYIPPPEQHLFGGYNTWAARSAGLEVTAEPRITEACIELLEAVTGSTRRPYAPARGSAADAIAATRPVAWWRLDEFHGPIATDATGKHHDAMFEPMVTYYLEGARSEVFGTPGQKNRAVMFAGGRMRAQVPGTAQSCSLSMWIWNGMPHDGRTVSGWFFSQGPDYGLSPHGLHLGVGGSGGHPGRLILMDGHDPAIVAAGSTRIPRWEWQHVVLVRDNHTVRVYLNGQQEFQHSLNADPAADHHDIFFGGRSDRSDNWEGRLDEIAVFDRVLNEDEIRTLSAR